MDGWIDDGRMDGWMDGCIDWSVPLYIACIGGDAAHTSCFVFVFGRNDSDLSLFFFFCFCGGIESTLIFVFFRCFAFFFFSPDRDVLFPVLLSVFFLHLEQMILTRMYMRCTQ